MKLSLLPYKNFVMLLTVIIVILIGYTFIQKIERNKKTEYKEESSTTLNAPVGGAEYRQIGATINQYLRKRAEISHSKKPYDDWLNNMLKRQGQVDYVLLNDFGLYNEYVSDTGYGSRFYISLKSKEDYKFLVKDASMILQGSFSEDEFNKWYADILQMYEWDDHFGSISRTQEVYKRFHQ